MTTRTSFFLFGFLLLLSCKQPKTKTPQSINSTHNTTNENCNFTQLDIIDSLYLSKDFKLDSNLKFDRTRNLEIQIILPKYINSKKFDKEVSKYFQSRLHDYIFSLDTLIHKDSSMLKAVPNAFIVNPVSVYKDDRLLSCCFIINSDYAGNAHPFEEYYSFNYDLKKNKQIDFFNFFNISSKVDSVFLENKINNAIYKEYPDIYKTFFNLKKLYNIDFNIEADSINFNFDDYEIGSYAVGIVKVKVNKKSLDKVITNNYR